jgi:hypothetical protein
MVIITTLTEKKKWKSRTRAFLTHEPLTSSRQAQRAPTPHGEVSFGELAHRGARLSEGCRDTVARGSALYQS